MPQNDIQEAQAKLHMCSIIQEELDRIEVLQIKIASDLGKLLVQQEQLSRQYAELNTRLKGLMQ